MSFPERRWNQTLHERLPHHVGSGVPERTLDRGIEFSDRSRVIHRHDAVERGLENRALSGMAVVEGALRLPLNLAARAGTRVLQSSISGGESAQLVSGLPTRIEPIREVTWPYLGAFSPDGRYWAEVVPNVDAIGRRLDHGNQVYVVDVDRDGASELVADFGLQYFGIDGARWLDRTTFAVTYSERSQTTIAIIGLTDGEWRVEHLSLPEGETSGGRLWAPGSDPCEVLSRSVRQPGCAAPWR